jgi:hypothetical protein
MDNGGARGGAVTAALSRRRRAGKKIQSKSNQDSPAVHDVAAVHERARGRDGLVGEGGRVRERGGEGVGTPGRRQVVGERVESTRRRERRGGTRRRESAARARAEGPGATSDARPRHSTSRRSCAASGVCARADARRLHESAISCFVCASAIWFRGEERRERGRRGGVSHGRAQVWCARRGGRRVYLCAERSNLMWWRRCGGVYMGKERAVRSRRFCARGRRRRRRRGAPTSLRPPQRPQSGSALPPLPPLSPTR